MAEFKVVNVIDGDTFEVTPQWRWNGQAGTRVRPTGYDAAELHEPGGQAAKKKLSDLLRGERVDLRTAYKIDHGRLVVDVYFNGKNLADYFREYR